MHIPDLLLLFSRPQTDSEWPEFRRLCPGDQSELWIITWSDQSQVSCWRLASHCLHHHRRCNSGSGQLIHLWNVSSSHWLQSCELDNLLAKWVISTIFSCSNSGLFTDLGHPAVLARFETLMNSSPTSSQCWLNILMFTILINSLIHWTNKLWLMRSMEMILTFYFHDDNHINLVSHWQKTRMIQGNFFLDSRDHPVVITLSSLAKSECIVDLSLEIHGRMLWR